MSIDIEHDNNGPRSNKALAGIVLLLVGFAFLIKELNLFFIPYWLFSFWSLLVVIGLYIGARHNFRNIAWLVLVIIGGINMIDDMLPRINIHNEIFPLILIAIGIRVITNRNKPWGGRWSSSRWNRNRTWDTFGNPVNRGPETGGAEFKEDPSRSYDYAKAYGTDDSVLDVTSIFSGVKRKILSKEFRGGEIINFFGGSDIDFTMADINGRVYIDVTQVFGGIKLIVPPHWHVTSDMVSLFAGFDDKRMQKNDYGSDKVLVLKGTSIFAGVEIRSY